MSRLISALLSLLLLSSVDAGCPLSPTSDQTSGSRLPGDGGYRILISGDHDKYIPNAVYTVSLQGPSDNERPQEFKRFTLSVDSQHAPFNPTARVGFFQIFPDSLTEFNEDCVNTVSEVSDYPKSEVQVMWRAPPAGSGCVMFTAMVLENPNRWYAEDGHLSRTFCEMSAKETESLDELRCCACDEAKYKLVLEGLWSNTTHPKDFPRTYYLTHFSDAIGASHATNFSFWGRDHVATDGFRQFAEWGSADALEAELMTKARYLKTFVKAPGLWYPKLNTNTSTEFSVDRKHPLLSIASTMGPSPDWIVGVSKLNVCQRDCTWMRGMTIDLYPWDAGTDNGITYMSPNSETKPRELMKPITTMYPEDPRSPFYDPSGKPMLPVARLYLDRVEVKKRGCRDEDGSEDAAIGHDYVVDDEVDDVGLQNAEEKPECLTTAYSDWSPCSVSCGRGTRTRKRVYRSPEKAELAGCKSQLVAREGCLGLAGECSIRNEDHFSIPVLTEDNDCETSDWSNWTECSASCGIGFKTRRRTLSNSANGRSCDNVGLAEKERCRGTICASGADNNNEEEACKTTDWSKWSHCSVTCGKGVRTRTRTLLVAPNLRIECNKKLELVQHRPCLDQADCTFDKATAKVICTEKTEHRGPCRGYFEHWTFNQEKLACVPFIYGGCRGNKNNFRTLEECEKTCDVVKESLANVQTSTPSRERLDRKNLRSLSRASLPEKSIDCQVSDWSPWSACSVACGNGFVLSTREVTTQPENGGKPCPKRLQRRARCHLAPCEF